MPDFANLIQQGSAHAWLFIPSAVILGILHGLEPGHSKTMMAAFIIAVRGTVRQAVLLGIAATVSHTAIVCVIAFLGLYIWNGVNTNAIEPYFQMASAVVIIGMALWMLRQTWKEQQASKQASGHDHSHPAHHHHHGDDIRRIDTGHGIVSVEVFEDGVPPRWRFKNISGHGWRGVDVRMTTARPDGSVQTFAFAERGPFLVSVDEIPEPHEFTAKLSLGHAGHSHDYDLSFVEHHDHHEHKNMSGLELSSDGYVDAHQRAHANDIKRRFSDGKVSTWQIVLFGLTGGLIPCPAAITVLLLCLQLKQFTLGFALVLCFSIGLAITLVTVGALAALSVRHATNRWSWFSVAALRAPYISGLLIIAVGLYVGLHGWTELTPLTNAPAAAVTTP